MTTATFPTHPTTYLQPDARGRLLLAKLLPKPLPSESYPFFAVFTRPDGTLLLQPATPEAAL